MRSRYHLRQASGRGVSPTRPVHASRNSVETLPARRAGAVLRSAHRPSHLCPGRKPRRTSGCGHHHRHAPGLPRRLRPAGYTPSRTKHRRRDPEGIWRKRPDPCAGPLGIGSAAEQLWRLVERLCLARLRGRREPAQQLPGQRLQCRPRLWRAARPLGYRVGQCAQGSARRAVRARRAWWHRESRDQASHVQDCRRIPCVCGQLRDLARRCGLDHPGV
jgi:hypothetical protein